MQPRVGIYAWAGPGTIRLLETKYFNPKIDRESFLSAYDSEYLARLKELFSVTDAWVTYSWGFSDKTEKEDRVFLQEKLDHFARLGIRTHAYVQGFNVVTDDFQDADFFCRDPWGRLIPYSKGRSFICPNHPDTYLLISKRVQDAVQEAIDGVFVDNILFGIPPFTVASDVLPFFGCSCRFCQEKFQATFGYPLPVFEKRGEAMTDYLRFRADSITALLSRLARIAHDKGKEFGINLYDPAQRLDTLYYGYSQEAIDPFLDYYLIENHSVPTKKSNNSHLSELLSKTKKPVFVVSYKDGIGYERQYNQEDINNIFSEANLLGYYPCLKVSEFTTNSLWYMLKLENLSIPRIKEIPSIMRRLPLRAKKSSLPQRLAIKHFSRFVTTMIGRSQTSKAIAVLVSKTGIHKQEVNKPRVVIL